ncbi:MAG: hypothetical protein ACYC2H_01205 [Thermoplasmatota archaeon]
MKKKAASTALAKKKAPGRPRKPQKAITRTKTAPRSEIAAPDEAAALQQRTLTGDAVELGQLGLVELKTTPEEEAVLSAPVDLSLLRVKPNGAVYEPHPVLTARMNKAFGRFGWVLVIAGHPQKVTASTGKFQVVCPYRLYVHGKEVAFAWGEQDYYEKNAEQSYGDALEATSASALRRCCKHIGVASELWDKEFTLNYLREHAIQVVVSAKDRDGTYKDKKQWRRKIDPPLPYEKQQPTGKPQRQADPGAVASAGTHPQAQAPITDPQRRRLFTILGNSGRSETELRDYLRKQHNVASTKEITRAIYDTVVQWINHPTPPVATPNVTANVIDWGEFTVADADPRDPREPGEEG